MSGPLRYILVGTGGWGAQWCRTFLPPLKDSGRAIPVAAVDVNGEKLRYAQEYLGLSPQHCFTDFIDAVHKRRADFAIIVVPPQFHERYVDMALTFDLHILCEHPLALDMETCLRIYRKVRNSSRKMGIVASHRFDPDKQALAELVRSRRYGRVNYVVCRFTENCRAFGTWGKYRHEMQDPLLIEAAVHYFDVFRAICECNARTVHAASWNPPWGRFGGDSTALVTIEMDSGAYCLYEGAKANASTLNGWGNEYFRVECEHGTLELDRRRLRVFNGGAMEEPRVELVPLPEQPAWGAVRVAEMFCDWLAGGEKPPITLRDAMRTTSMVFAAVQSSRTGREIDVHQFLDQWVDATSSTRRADADQRPEV